MKAIEAKDAMAYMAAHYKAFKDAEESMKQIAIIEQEAVETKKNLVKLKAEAAPLEAQRNAALKEIEEANKKASKIISDAENEAKQIYIEEKAKIDKERSILGVELKKDQDRRESVRKELDDLGVKLTEANVNLAQANRDLNAAKKAKADLVESLK